MNNIQKNGSEDGASEFEVELQEWLDSLDYVMQSGGPERVRYILEQLEMAVGKT